MEALKSSFIFSTPLKVPSSKPSKKSNSKSTCTFVCSVTPDPWTLSDGNKNNSNFNKPKPRSKNPKNPLSDDNARRIIKAKARYLSALRRNQGSGAQTPKWIKRTPEQMVQYLEDDRNGHLYGRHVIAAIRRVRSLSEKAGGSYNMREEMGSFVAKLTFREMCIVLKEQKGWRQVRDFFSWMKLQVLKRYDGFFESKFLFQDGIRIPATEILKIVLSYRPSVIVYTIVLRAYGKVGKIKLAEQVFLEMLEAGCEPDEVACGTMLCAYARWGWHKAMLSFYSAVQERGIKPSTAVFNFMLSSLQKKSLHGNVLNVWRQMADDKVVPDHFSYTVVISSFLKQDLADDAFRTFNKMKNLGFVPEEATYSLLISLNIKSGRHNEAFDLYKEMRSHRIIPSNFTCASLLTSYYKTGDYSKALSLFSEMERYGIRPDEVIFGLLIRIYGKLGLYEDAQKTFEGIEKLGLLSDEKSYTTMAQVHLNYGSVDKALSLMGKIKSKNTLLSRFALIVLLQCYARKGDLAAAESIFCALSKTGSADCGSCDIMLNLYMKNNLIEKAKDFILHMQKDKVEFDEELLKKVMEVYCKEGMLRDAKQLIDELGSGEPFQKSTFLQTLSLAINGSRAAEASSETFDIPDLLALEMIVVLCLKNKSSIDAEKTITLLLKSSNGLLVACQLISKFSKEGNVSEAEFLYKLLMKLGNKPEYDACGSLISLYGKQQKLKEAKEVFAKVADSSGTCTILYNSMVDAYIKCNRQEDAYMFFKEVIEEGHSLGPVAISMLVNALINCGKYRVAEDVIQKCFSADLELDTVAYNTFIKAMLEAGKLRFAARIYERMVSHNVAPSIHTCNTMISVYGRGRNLDKAVEMFNMVQIKGMTLDEKAYTNMICYLGKAGETQEASLLFKKMQEEGIEVGKVSYNVMINIYAAAGLFTEAEELFYSMREKGCLPDSYTYLSLIRAYTQGLNYVEGEKVITLMQKEGLPLSCAHFNVLLSSFAKEGLITEAERVHKEITAAGLTPDLECNRAMLRCYMDHGRVAEGISFFEKICETVEPDRFIMSAAIHMYKSEDMELKAEALLKSMNSLKIQFLKNLVVGQRVKTP